MDNNFAALNSLVIVAVVIGVGKKLTGWSWWARGTATLLAAAAVGGTLSYGEMYIVSYNERYDPVAAAAAIDQEMLMLSPTLVPVVKEDDPQAWQAFITTAGQKFAASGGNLSPDDKKQLQGEFQAILKSVWLAVSMADDGAILALGRQEIVVDETLQRETVKMCASRGEPLWNLNDLPPASLQAVQGYMALVAAAYRQGQGRQSSLPSDDQAHQLLRQALFWEASPLSNEDAAYLGSGDKTDPARLCRVRLQFERNLMSIPENTTLLRWLYAHSQQ